MSDMQRTRHNVSFNTLVCTEWNNWSDCSTTCNGVQHRTRHCQNATHESDEVQAQPCNVLTCLPASPTPASTTTTSTSSSTSTTTKVPTGIPDQFYLDNFVDLHLELKTGKKENVFSGWLCD